MTQEALTKRIEEYLSAGGLFNPELANHVAVRDLLIECHEALAQTQEPVAWATREDFYRELDRTVNRMRQQMEIKGVVMRCADYDIALPVIDIREGHVLVGQVATPPQPEQEHFALKHRIAELEGAVIGLQAQLAQTERPVDCERCNRLEEQAYDLVGKLRVANIKLSMQPQRKPLTENAIKHLWYEACQTNLELTSQLIVHLARNIEAAHGIKENT